MRTRGLMNRTMSWIVSPDSMWPPCELMKIVIGSSLDSAAIASSCAVTRAASCWLISPLMMMVRARNSRSLVGSVVGPGVSGRASLTRPPSLPFSWCTGRDAARPGVRLPSTPLRPGCSPAGSRGGRGPHEPRRLGGAEPREPLVRERGVVRDLPHQLEPRRRRRQRLVLVLQLDLGQHEAGELLAEHVDLPPADRVAHLLEPVLARHRHEGLALLPPDRDLDLPPHPRAAGLDRQQVLAVLLADPHRGGIPREVALPDRDPAACALQRAGIRDAAEEAPLDLNQPAPCSRHTPHPTRSHRAARGRGGAPRGTRTTPGPYGRTAAAAAREAAGHQRRILLSSCHEHGYDRAPRHGTRHHYRARHRHPRARERPRHAPAAPGA